MKRLLAIILVLSCLILTSTSFAASNINYSLRDDGHATAKMDNTIQRRYGVCPKCTNFDIALVCLGDEYHKGTKSHSTSSGQCTYYQYSSRSAYTCFSCGYVESIDGEHYCFDRHLNCSKGDSYCCPCDIY